MNLRDLTTLLDFHYWARDRVMDAVAQLTPEQYAREVVSSFPSVRATLVHLYSAEWAWYHRWTGVSPASMIDLNQFPDLSSLRAAWIAQEGQVRALLASFEEGDVGRQFPYTSFDGRPQSSAFSEMLQHLVNHGTYHRGQVTTMLRQLGAAPARNVDLITFYRERQAAG